jgi:hypothetical protein
MIMNARKIAVVGSLVAGAALALAPLAAADDLTSTYDTEVTVLNDLFQFDAALAGDSNDITVATTPGVFDTIIPADLSTVAPHLVAGSTATPTPLEYELYGVNPIAAGISTTTGPYNELNGALTEFYNAYNSDVYGVLNGNTDLIPTTDLFGGTGPGTEIFAALGTGTDFGAATSFFEAGLNDLAGFFQIPLTF